MHIAAFIGSVKNLSKWKLYVPDFIIIFTTIISGIIFSNLSGISASLFGGISIQDTINAFLADKNKLLVLMYSFIGFLLTNFFIGSGVIAIKYVMIRDNILGKTVEFKRSFVEGSKYMFKVILVKIFTYYIFFIPAFILGFESYIQPLFSDADPQLGWIAVSIFGLSMWTLSIILDVIFFFRWPELFFNNCNVRKTIKHALLFTKNHYLVVFFTWGFVFLLGFLINALAAGVGSLNPLIGFTLIVVLIRAIILLFYNLWKDLFVFQTYFNYQQRKS
jgi:hypothetical protein